MTENEPMQEYIPGGGKRRLTPRPAEVAPAPERLKSIYNMLVSKKAEDIRILDLKQVNDYLEYFVLATVTSEAHLNGLAKELSRMMKKAGEVNTASHSNATAGGWIVLDYIDIVVHLFTTERRSFYNLDKLWGDSEDITDRFTG